MKKSDLKKIIREEIVEVLRGQLNEAFGDPIAAKLSKMGGIRAGRWQNFWRSAAKTYDIAWDKLPKGSFRKVSPSSSEVKKGMAFYVINSDKENPYDSIRINANQSKNPMNIYQNQCGRMDTNENQREPMTIYEHQQKSMRICENQ